MISGETNLEIWELHLKLDRLIDNIYDAELRPSYESKCSRVLQDVEIQTERRDLKLWSQSLGKKIPYFQLGQPPDIKIWGGCQKNLGENISFLNPIILRSASKNEDLMDGNIIAEPMIDFSFCPYEFTRLMRIADIMSPILEDEYVKGFPTILVLFFSGTESQLESFYEDITEHHKQELDKLEKFNWFAGLFCIPIEYPSHSYLSELRSQLYEFFNRVKEEDDKEQ